MLNVFCFGITFGFHVVHI